MAFRVKWTHSAQKDREKILSFRNKNNGSNDFSGNPNRKIQESISITRNFPDAGLATDRKGVRFHLIEQHYKLFYKVEDESIIILRFWDCRQDPDKLKEL
jgi:plasmid stabilization system protein ParE